MKYFSKLMKIMKTNWKIVFIFFVLGGLLFTYFASYKEGLTTTKPTTTKPTTTKPATTKPTTTKPATTKPATTKPATTKPTTTKPATTKPATTKPATTKPASAKTTTKPTINPCGAAKGKYAPVSYENCIAANNYVNIKNQITPPSKDFIKTKYKNYGTKDLMDLDNAYNQEVNNITKNIENYSKSVQQGDALWTPPPSNFIEQQNNKLKNITIPPKK